PVDDRKSGPDCPFGVILMRLGVAEIDQHAVAEIFGDKAGVAADGFPDTAMIGADHFAQVLWVVARRQRRRAHQVAEHHGSLPALGPFAPRCGGRLLPRACVERSDRAQHPLAVAEHYPELLEIRLGQFGQNLEIDRVFAKDRFILRQIETAQPLGNVHGLPGGLPPKYEHYPDDETIQRRKAMTVTIYHNPRCNTSRKTLALLREKGVEPQVIEYLK